LAVASPSARQLTAERRFCGEERVMSNIFDDVGALRVTQSDELQVERLSAYALLKRRATEQEREIEQLKPESKALATSDAIKNAIKAKKGTRTEAI
jgi:hypothetical protein